MNGGSRDGLTVALAVGFVLVAVALMAALHEGHYRRRRFLLLESEVAALRALVVGDHTL